MPGVGLALGQLGEHRLHVDLLADRLAGDVVLVEQRLADLAARRGRHAHHVLHRRLVEVGERLDVRRVVAPASPAPSRWSRRPAASRPGPTWRCPWSWCRRWPARRRARPALPAGPASPRSRTRTSPSRPGCSSSNCLPSSVNVPVSDDAASTVIVVLSSPPPQAVSGRSGRGGRRQRDDAARASVGARRRF